MKKEYNRYYLYLYCTHFTNEAHLNWKALSSNRIIQGSLLPIRRRLKADMSVIKDKKEAIKALIKLISMDYFGSSRNKNLFIHLVQKILNHRRREFIHISLLSQEFQNCFEWSSNTQNDEVFQEVVKSANIYLLEKCVKPFIEKHFFSLAQRRSHGIDLIPRPVWQKFRDRVFHQMKLKKHIELNEAFAEMLPRGSLRLFPKENFSGYRPLISFFKKNETAKGLNYINELKKKLKRYFILNKLHSRFFQQSWTDFINKSGHKKIYGVKVDAEDSFGNIDIDKMCHIIEKIPQQFLSQQDKTFLINRIRNQYVSFNSKKHKITVKWCHGLLQGDRLSSILCDLYYLLLVDHAELKHCMEGNYFFHRTMDDYIFCSTNKENVGQFYMNICNALVLNKNKIYSNLEQRDIELQYCGYRINLNTKEIWLNWNLTNVNVNHQFKLWYDSMYYHPNSYLSEVMKFRSLNFFFSKIVFNTNYNYEESILKIYFQSMLYLGIKFDCAFMQLREYHLEYTSNETLMVEKILSVIKTYALKSQSIIWKNKGHLFQDEIKFEHLQAVGVRAFILILKHRHSLYRPIIELLKSRAILKIKIFEGFDTSFFTKVPINMKYKINQKTSQTDYILKS